MHLQNLIPVLLAGVGAVDALHLSKRADTCGLPSNYSPAANSKLPNPFVSASGTQVTTQAQWACRQQELSAILQQYEYGTIPPKPSSVTASFSGSSLTINVGQSGKSASFSVSIKKPSGNGPFPAIIAYGAASIPVPNNVATITFNNDQIAAQAGGNSRGQGKFYDLYGSNHPAGAIAAWAWGVSRIIDALELTPAAGIDTTRIGVTGCSRNGKGAFAAGAFDSRVALTLPQEPGAGGMGCWRVSDSEKSKGKNIQTASQIITENPWFGPAFNTYTSRIPSLPHDHHELAALVAPRGLLVIENDIDWLGPVAAGVCGKAARLIYKAVGAADHMGYSQAANHAHCSFPSSQQPELSAFINKFFFGQSANTNVEKLTVTANVGEWVNWTPPTLTGSVPDGPVDSPDPPATQDPVPVPTSPSESSSPSPPEPTESSGGGGAVAQKWGQCGGQGWTGPTTCAAGSTCKASNQWYSQCL